MKRSHSEMLSSGDQYLYIILMYWRGDYSHSLHRISVSELMISSSSGSSSRHSRGRCHGKGKPPVTNLPKPILKLKRFPDDMGFFCVGSKIYMVGGSKGASGYRDCYVYDTCKENNPSNVVVDGPPMVYEKRLPIVLGPVNGGKFYVLSHTLASRDLEEFDPQTESWTPFPPPHPLADHDDFYNMRDGFAVMSHAIVGDRIFFSTDRGIYAFHVILHTWEYWTAWGRSLNLRFPFAEEAHYLDDTGFWFAMDGIKYKTHVWAHSFDEFKGRFGRRCRAHGVRRPSRLVKYENNGIAVPMGQRTLCIVRSGFPHRRHYFPYNITVDLCEFTQFRVERRSGKPKHPNVYKQYSATYTLNKDYKGIYPDLDACLIMSSD